MTLRKVPRIALLRAGFLFMALGLTATRWPLLIWLSTVALPLWLAGELNGATATAAINCSLVVIVLLILPWPYLVRQYVTRPRDRWLPQTRCHPHPPPHQEKYHHDYH